MRKRALGIDLARAAVLFVFVASAGALGCSKGKTASGEGTAVAARGANGANARADESAGARAIASPGSAVGDDGGKKAFGGYCAEDADCASGVCFHKRVKTPEAGKEHRGDDGPVEHDGYCSMKCESNDDCPVPPTKGKCGARGMCKRPE